MSSTPKFFPMQHSLFWLKIHLSSLYFGTIFENVNVVNIKNFGYFSLCLFGIFFLVLEFMGGGVSCMRLGGLSRMETQTPAKKEVPLFEIAIFEIEIIDGVNSNKQNCAN